MASNESESPSGFVDLKLVHDPKDESGAFLTCADIFVIVLGNDSEALSIWTDPESDKFWPRDILSLDPEFKDSCRIWTLTPAEIDAKLHCFQNCVPLQNYGFGSLHAIDANITSEGSSVPGRRDGKRPNNGVITMIGHGLGGVLAEMIASLILAVPLEVMHGYHKGLKEKDWRLILLGTPHLGVNILDDIEQITAIVAYYKGTGHGCDIHHTRGFWIGLYNRAQCLISNNWKEKGYDAPTDAHGTLKVACFQEGEQDEALAEELRSFYPNNPNINGFVVQESFSLFGGKALNGFDMPDAPPPVFPRMHKTMGQFKDENDECYRSLRAILKEFIAE